MSCFRKHCFTFSGPSHTHSVFFLFWIAIIFLIKDFSLNFIYLFFFAFKSFSKLSSISSNTNLKRDIACVLVLCLLHVVGAEAEVICHSLRWQQRSFCCFCYMVAQLFSDIPVNNSIVVPDQLPCFVVSYLGFHSLPKSVGLNARLKWVKVCWILDWFDVVEPNSLFGPKNACLILIFSLNISPPLPWSHQIFFF